MRIVRPLPPAGGVVHQALGQDGLTGLTFPKAEPTASGAGGWDK